MAAVIGSLGVQLRGHADGAEEEAPPKFTTNGDFPTPGFPNPEFALRSPGPVDTPRVTLATYPKSGRVFMIPDYDYSPHALYSDRSSEARRISTRLRVGGPFRLAIAIQPAASNIIVSRPGSLILQTDFPTFRGN